MTTNVSRQVQNLSDAFSIIGGFMAILTVVLKIAIGWYQELLFYSGIINEIYREVDYSKGNNVPLKS